MKLRIEISEPWNLYEGLEPCIIVAVEEEDYLSDAEHIVRILSGWSGYDDRTALIEPRWKDAGFSDLSSGATIGVNLYVSKDGQDYKEGSDLLMVIGTASAILESD